MQYTQFLSKSVMINIEHSRTAAMTILSKVFFDLSFDPYF